MPLQRSRPFGDVHAGLHANNARVSLRGAENLSLGIARLLGGIGAGVSNKRNRKREDERFAAAQADRAEGRALQREGLDLRREENLESRRRNTFLDDLRRQNTESLIKGREADAVLSKKREGRLAGQAMVGTALRVEANETSKGHLAERTRANDIAAGKAKTKATVDAAKAADELAAAQTELDLAQRLGGENSALTKAALMRFSDSMKNMTAAKAAEREVGVLSTKEIDSLSAMTKAKMKSLTQALESFNKAGARKGREAEAQQTADQISVLNHDLGELARARTFVETIETKRQLRKDQAAAERLAAKDRAATGRDERIGNQKAREEFADAIETQREIHENRISRLRSTERKAEKEAGTLEFEPDVTKIAKDTFWRAFNSGSDVFKEEMLPEAVRRARSDPRSKGMSDDDLEAAIRKKAGLAR